jgi:hypothetical protein
MTTVPLPLLLHLNRTNDWNMFHYVLLPRIRYMKNMFHYKYPYVKVLFVMCFIHRYPFMKHVSLYTRTWNMCCPMCFIQRYYSYIKHLFHFCFIHRYPYMKHVSLYTRKWNMCCLMCFIQRYYSYMKHISFLLHPQIPVYETSVFLCASSTCTIHEICFIIYTLTWNICFVMCFIHRYSYMKYVSFLLHPRIPDYETSLCASFTDTPIWNMFRCVLLQHIPVRETCFIMCSSTYETDPALNSFACFWLAL